jgi:hypothetical protein
MKAEQKERPPKGRSGWFFWIKQLSSRGVWALKRHGFRQQIDIDALISPEVISSLSAYVAVLA